MTQEEWRSSTNVEDLLAGLPATASRRKLRLFGVACCRRLCGSITHEATRFAVEQAERFADGEVSRSEMESSRKAANRFVRDSGSTPVEFMGAAVARVAFVPKWVALLGRQALAGSTESDATERAAQADLLRDIFGNPFRPATFSLEWRTDTAVTIARTMYDSRDFSAMPILADALQDAGCDSEDILSHCRDTSLTHVRGCWVVDLVLGMQ